LGIRTLGFFTLWLKLNHLRTTYSQLINENGVSVSNPAALKKLTIEAASWLEKPVTSSDIHRALEDMHPEKAPGPDGFNVIMFFSEKVKCGGQ